ncbi:MAG: hypothetical protein R3F34_11505 [Planctomycetota bacterium]
MLLRLRRGLAERELSTVLDEARRQGLRSHFLDESKTLLELSGSFGPDARSRFEDLWAVAAVLDADDAPELFRTVDPGTIEVGSARFGGGAFSIVAGPCAVAGRPARREIARAGADAGAPLLRGGAYKPRTSPHAFQGLGEQGLELLDEARATTGLGIVTEVLDPRDVAKVGEVCDMFQIGARSMANAARAPRGRSVREAGAAGSAASPRRCASSVRRRSTCSRRATSACCSASAASAASTPRRATSSTSARSRTSSARPTSPSSSTRATPRVAPTS